MEKYDVDHDAKLDAKEKGKVEQDKSKLLKEVRPEREAEKAKLKEKKAE